MPVLKEKTVSESLKNKREGEIENTLEKKNERVLALDGVRGIAVLVVILFHYFNNQYLSTDISALNKAEILIMQATSLGWAGVNLFFVLSGYLIGSILLKNRESGSLFKVFYLRRFARIIPIYYVLLLLYIIVKHTSLYNPEAYIFKYELPVAYYFAFLQNFSMAFAGSFGAQALTPTWSLAVEEQFYLIIPLVIYLLNYKNLKYFIAFCLIAAPVCRLFSTNWYAEYTLLFCRIDSPVIGLLIAYLMQNERFRLWIRNNSRFVFLGGLIVTIIFAALYAFTRIGFLNHTILGAIFACFVLISLQLRNGIIYRMLTHKALLSLGKYSYCIYLFHQIFNQLLQLGILKNLDPNLHGWREYAITIAAFIITYIFAKLSFKYFEGPLLKWAHRFRY